MAPVFAIVPSARGRRAGWSCASKPAPQPVERTPDRARATAARDDQCTASGCGSRRGSVAESGRRTSAEVGAACVDQQRDGDAPRRRRPSRNGSPACPPRRSRPRPAATAQPAATTSPHPAAHHGGGPGGADGDRQHRPVSEAAPTAARARRGPEPVRQPARRPAPVVVDVGHDVERSALRRRAGRPPPAATTAAARMRPAGRGRRRPASSAKLDGVRQPGPHGALEPEVVGPAAARPPTRCADAGSQPLAKRQRHARRRPATPQAMATGRGGHRAEGERLVGAAGRPVAAHGRRGRCTSRSTAGRSSTAAATSTQPAGRRPRPRPMTRRAS